MPGSVIVSLTEKELSFTLLSVRYMNHVLGNATAHSLSEMQRENLADYLAAKKEIRAAIISRNS